MPTVSKHFADRLIAAIEEKNNPSVAGLDPRIGSIPPHIRERAVRAYGDTKVAVGDAFREFLAPYH